MLEPSRQGSNQFCVAIIHYGGSLGQLLHAKNETVVEAVKIIHTVAFKCLHWCNSMLDMILSCSVIYRLKFALEPEQYVMFERFAISVHYTNVDDN
ncbi:hypothetical protein TNIN_104881 [Trichonephila inaurata madagascariensis]|uniref:Uncharacterized protein n=1 Tax=Trichonephila inaurata madagascariensis TaxID=2747483 RepID=A0A8X6WPX9_9ARAC|nr:hypothetical protein TNIN_104881 [Trichonephila inaurata madagascariensis]